MLPKEIYFWLKFHSPLYESVRFQYGIYNDYYETKEAIDSNKEIIHTSQLCFINTDLLDKNYRIFIYLSDDNVIEIEYGKNTCTKRFIKKGNNLLKLLLAGEFGEV